MKPERYLRKAFVSAMMLLCSFGLSIELFAAESPLVKQMYDGGWPSAEENSRRCTNSFCCSAPCRVT